MNIKIKFGIISLVVILFQSILKVIGVLITGSLSFLSETVDTLIDILFVTITIYSIHQSEKPADLEHMYGHSKMDSIGVLVEGLILTNVYAVLIFYAFQAIISGDFRVSNPEVGIQLLIVSFIVNLIFSRILIWQGRSRKSLTLEIQGLNLFQDSIRAIIVLINLIFAIFNIFFLDPFFSIALSIWIIIGSVGLVRNGINNLTDTNPVNFFIIEEIRQEIFNLDHVNGVQDLKIRASGNKLFLEAILSVEDHISIVHAHEIIKSIKTLSKKVLPLYDIECIISMNPLSSETSIGETLMNLIYSMKPEFPDVVDIKNLNIFTFENKLFISLSVVVDESLTLEAAHETSTRFENQLKKEYPQISRIITHIEGQPLAGSAFTEQVECLDISSENMPIIRKNIEKILRSNLKVKGYHGLEFWTATDCFILELHVFFEGSLNISMIHKEINELENKIRTNLNIEKLEEVILHSEPLKGRIDGTIF